MARFRKKSLTVEAVQITQPMQVETLEGVMKGNSGDWLITGVKGEQYFCKPDIFEQTYEPAAELIEDGTERVLITVTPFIKGSECYINGVPKKDIVKATLIVDATQEQPLLIIEQYIRDSNGKFMLSPTGMKILRRTFWYHGTLSLEGAVLELQSSAGVVLEREELN